MARKYKRASGIDKVKTSSFFRIRISIGENRRIETVLHRGNGSQCPFPPYFMAASVVAPYFQAFELYRRAWNY